MYSSTQKILVLGFLVLAVVAFMPQVAEACSATCGGDTCSGSGTCRCVNGAPECTDAPVIAASLAFDPSEREIVGFLSYLDQLSSESDPALVRIGDLAWEVYDSVLRQDFEAYLDASFAHQQAVGTLAPDLLERYAAVIEAGERFVHLSR